MDLAAHLRKALGPIPSGSNIPVDWVRTLIDEAGGSEGVDLTVQEAATLLDRAPSTLRTWCAADQVPGAYRLQGREWRIPRASLTRIRNGGDSPCPRSGPVDLGRWREHVGEES